MVQASNAAVYEKLGTIVRSLHDALRELGADAVLAEAAVEFPSARERLLHIGRLTEKAANTVLGKVEETDPIQLQLIAKAKLLNNDWSDASTRSHIPDSLMPLVGRTVQFITCTEDGCNATRVALSDMMIAQDFQDLTGQLIKKVVSVLERTENDLLKLLINAAPPETILQISKDEVMAGPGAPGSLALEQTAVDELLANMGF